MIRREFLLAVLTVFATILTLFGLIFGSLYVNQPPNPEISVKVRMKNTLDDFFKVCWEVMHNKNLDQEAIFQLYLGASFVIVVVIYVIAALIWYWFN